MSEQKPDVMPKEPLWEKSVYGMLLYISAIQLSVT